MVPGRSGPAQPAAPSARELLGLLLLVVLAVARVAGTYRVLTQTIDEPVHLAAGMEVLDQGQFSYNLMHPPLSRLPIALGPWLDGAHSWHKADPVAEGNEILQAQGHYVRTLTLARLGVLPFLVLAIVGTWRLARTLFGPLPAFLAAAAFSLLPPVLAHAGLATTDMAITGIMPWVLLVGLRWLDEPGSNATPQLGLLAGIAVLLKFSALVFVPACLAAMLAAKLVLEPGTSRQKLQRWRRLEVPTLMVLAIAALAIWAGYGFSLGTLASLGIGSLFPPAVANAPFLPAPAFWHGLLILTLYNDGRMPAYLMGEVRQGGWWYFFPVALALKTPLALLALAGTGLVVTLQQAWRHQLWRVAVPAVAAAALLLSVLRSNLALGVRHILPIYAPLAILAAIGALVIWHAPWPRRAGRVLAVALGAWLAAASARAHPDYLSSYNELALGAPERYLVNSDLDWGQDVGRLADTLRARGIDSLTVYLFGFHDPRLLGSPPGLRMPPWFPATKPTTGWVAASAFPLYVIPRIDWLLGRTPVTRVGPTIYLYYIPPDTSRTP